MKFKKTFLLLFIIAFAFGCNTTGSKVKITEDGKRIYDSKKDERLEKKAIIKGYITDKKTNKAISNATVEMKNSTLGMGYYIVKTNSNGYFEIKDFITHVNYILEVTANGYVPYKLTRQIESGKYTISLNKEAVITGRITDKNGNSIKNVEVILKKRNYYGSQNKPIIKKSDSFGNYKFNKLSNSGYHITFRKGEYISENAKIKYLKSGEKFKLPMTLYKPASISGKITIEDLDVPAVNLNVIAVGKYRHATSTYHDGSYQLNDLKPGKYRVQINHRGFYSKKSKILYLKEGDLKKDFNFFVKPRKPELNVYTYRYTFAPGNKLSFNMRTFRLEKIKATIYKVPLNTFLKGKSDPDNLNIKKEKFKIVSTWDEPIHNFKPYEWKYQTLEIKDPLPTGGYCLEIKGANKIISRKFFTITSTGVVVKRSQKSIFAYVTNLVTNKPMLNASVVIFDSTPKKKRYRKRTYPYNPPKRIEHLPVKILYKGKTNDNGIFKYKLKTNKHLSILVIGNDKSYALCSTGSPIAFEREKNKYFIYTDRPVYRSGDTVAYKIIGKNRQKHFLPKVGQKLFYKIKNRDRGKTVKEGTITLDNWGTANGKIKIEAISGLGEYEIKVGPSYNNLYGVGRFYVEQYRKPEFNVEITPAKDYFVNGDQAKFRVVAKYFFGAPLKGAFVKYRFYETKLRDTDTKYWWEEDSPSNNSYNRIKLEGNKYLNNNGITALRLNTGNHPYDRNITVEVTVTDQSNISITTKKIVKVGRGQYYIKLNPKKNFFADNEKKEIEVKTLTHTGKPFSTKLELKLYKYIWKPYQRVYVHARKPLLKKTVHTNEKGIAIVELPKKFQYYGEFDLIAKGQDSRGNIINGSRIVWIYNKHGGTIASKFRNLELSVNKTVLKKPGNITCLIKSRFKDAHVCLTIEGKDIYKSKVVKLTGNITPVTIKVNPEYAPNFYLTATMQRKRALFITSKNISLPMKKTKLNISIKTDKKKYLPGEKVTINIKTEDDNNKAIAADLSIASVDESIYSIRPDHTPKMKNFFYTKISNWVLTSYSYPMNILAGASKEDKIKIRSKFKDTAFWKSNIKTNKNGKAQISFKLPDNLTTWRLTARGHDKSGRVGENRKKFIVTQDLISRIGKPRFFTERDKITIIGIVNNNTTKGFPSIKTKMLINNKNRIPDKKIKISLPAYGSARNYYTVKVPEKTNKMNIRYEARANQNAKDGLKISVPIQKRGASYNLYGIGDMVNNKKITLKSIKQTDDFKFVPEKIKISLNPSPILQMLKATNFLIEYPYGCIEQSTNKFLPLLAVQQLLKDKNLEYLIPEKKLKQIPNMTKKGIIKLSRAQNNDGSWGWWQGDRGNEHITAYVMQSFYLAKKFGYNVNKTTVRKGIKAIRRMIQKSSNVVNNDAKPFLLYVYALWGNWDNEVFINLKKKSHKNNYQIAYLLRALGKVNFEKISQRNENITINNFKKEYRYKFLSYKEINQTIKKIKEKFQKKLDSDLKEKRKNIKSLQVSLKQRLRKDGKGVYWQNSSSQSWGWAGANTEITAHVLAALVETNDKTTLPGQIVKSLSKRNRGNSWVTTKQTATVILSICKYMQKNKIDIGKKANIIFSMNGKKLTSFNFDPKKIRNSENLEKEIFLNNFDPKKKITILAEGTGGNDITFDVIANGTLYFTPSKFNSIFKSENSSLQSLTNGIQLHRKFLSIKRVKDMHNREYLVPQELKNVKKIKIGDELLVKVKFIAQDNFEYLMLEDFLPSGFEVTKKNSYDYYKPYVHSEKWDNRMIFFFNGLKRGKIYEVAYIIRAELPGNFYIRPSKIECMYEPSIQGWATPFTIDIKKSKNNFQP